MNFSQGRSGTKVQCELCLFSQRKTPEFTKMGEVHELFVFALFLVWFAGATPEKMEKFPPTPSTPTPKKEPPKTRPDPREGRHRGRQLPAFLEVGRLVLKTKN